MKESVSLFARRVKDKPDFKYRNSVLLKKELTQKTHSFDVPRITQTDKAIQCNKNFIVSLWFLKIIYRPTLKIKQISASSVNKAENKSHQLHSTYSTSVLLYFSLSLFSLNSVSPLDFAAIALIDNLSSVDTTLNRLLRSLYSIALRQISCWQTYQHKIEMKVKARCDQKYEVWTPPMNREKRIESKYKKSHLH